jgi:hypothetical protein
MISIVIGMMFMEKVKEFVIYNKRNAHVHLNRAFFNILFCLKVLN